MAKEPPASQKNADYEPEGQKEAVARPPAQAGPIYGAGTTPDPQLVQQILQALATLPLQSISIAQAPLRSIDLATPLAELPPVTVAFPPCSDVLLSLIDSRASPADEINGFFSEYFSFDRHEIMHMPQGQSLNTVLDPGLVRCTSGGPALTAHVASSTANWPPAWCLPPSCVTLRGNRRLPAPTTLSVKRLFLADVLWLYFFERMGIFKILGVILDDFATRGGYPISNGSLEAGLRDDVAALVLESMCRQTKAGLSSTVRDRDATYRRCLGWTSDVGRPLDLPSQVNKGLSQQFHKLLQSAVRFNEAKRLGRAIQGLTTQPKPSVATLAEIADSLTHIQQRLEAFHYGRSYYNTLSGIVWAVAGLALLRELRATLGIPPAYNEPHEYVPVAYDILVLGRKPTQTALNRYESHKDCATLGRNLLLDVEVLPKSALQNPQEGGPLDLWLAQVEGEIEGYRKAYRDLTGTDLGAPGTPTIEQEP